MDKYSELGREELLALKKELEASFEEKKALNLQLDMSRGKPSTSQLDVSQPILDVLDSASTLTASDGIDCRNYGGLDGIPEAKQLMSEMMGTAPEHVIIYGNASLTIMYDSISRSYTHGVLGHTPWCRLDSVKFLCPVPGYDRHFAITERFGIEMINIPMNDDGPDMDMVEKLVAEDDSVKGIWCVPKYSNPQGICYSDETVRRFAALKPAAEDFRIYWDNAYAIHHLYDDNQIEILDIISECEKAGNPDMVYEFASTSKVSFSGSGVAALASSPANLEGLKAHMKKHAAEMRPKFEAVLKIFDEELAGAGIGTWKKPLGGYFISFDAMDGCAKKIVAKCKEAGVTLTNAGATFPYGNDPKDSNIRIAPSFPTPKEMAEATELFVLCVKLVSIDKLLEEK